MPHGLTLPLEEVAYRSPEIGIGQEMRRRRYYRLIAARQLMLALSTGLNASQSMPDHPIDRPIIAELEMKEGTVLDRAPVAPVKCVGTDEIECPGHRSSFVKRKEHQRRIAHRLTDALEELRCQIRSSPLARAGMLIEAPHGRPMVGVDVRAAKLDDFQSFDRCGSFLADRLALAAGEPAQEIVKAGIAAVEPMILKPVATQPSARLCGA